MEEIGSYAPVSPVYIKGCTKQHVIVFESDGTYSMKQALCDCESCIMGDIRKCQYDNDSFNISIKADSDFEDEDDGNGEQIDLDDDVEDDGDDVEDFSMISELVEPGKFLSPLGKGGNNSSN